MNLLQKVERNHGKHSMKFRFCTRFFVSLILMCGYLGAMAQNIQISGVVKDVVGDPLIGVSVLVKGGTKEPLPIITAFTPSRPQPMERLFFHMWVWIPKR